MVCDLAICMSVTWVLEQLGKLRYVVQLLDAARQVRQPRATTGGHVAQLHPDTYLVVFLFPFIGQEVVDVGRQ